MAHGHWTCTGKTTAAETVHSNDVKIARNLFTNQTDTDSYPLTGSRREWSRNINHLSSIFCRSNVDTLAPLDRAASIDKWRTPKALQWHEGNNPWVRSPQPWTSTKYTTKTSEKNGIRDLAGYWFVDLDFYDLSSPLPVYKCIQDCTWINSHKPNFIVPIFLPEVCFATN